MKGKEAREIDGDYKESCKPEKEVEHYYSIPMLKDILLKIIGYPIIQRKNYSNKLY